MERRILDRTSRARGGRGHRRAAREVRPPDPKVLIGLGAAIVVLIGVVVKAVVLTTASSDPDVTWTQAWIYLGNTLADLTPGDSVNTAVVFDVPRGTDVMSIELHDGPFPDGVTVAL